jgi:hypothetical protein
MRRTAQAGKRRRPVAGDGVAAQCILKKLIRNATSAPVETTPSQTFASAIGSEKKH